MLIKNGVVFCDDGIFRKQDIATQNDTIAAIGENLPHSDGECIDAQGAYITPGLVDIHTHGAMGADFGDGTKEATETIARFLLKNGITSFLGTTMSLPESQLSAICKTAAPMVNATHTDMATMRGIHLEGPFFSQEKRGAQNAEYIIKPDIKMFMRLYEASKETVKLIAAAPELENCFEFIKAVAPTCKVSLAHSTADYKTAYEAFSLGADHVTHLYNGMNPYNHRDPGIIGAAYDSKAYVEIISDGVHLHPSVVRATFELFGDDKVCLISDSMRACGLADGQYDLGGQLVTVVGSSATIDSGSLAGSVTNLADCMRNAVNFGVPLEKALKAATINPAKSTGLDKKIGSLTVGKRADILVLEKDLAIKQIIFNGVKI